MASTKDETKTSKFESNRQNPKEQILPNKQFDVFILHCTLLKLKIYILLALISLKNVIIRICMSFLPQWSMTTWYFQVLIF